MTCANCWVYVSDEVAINSAAAPRNFGRNTQETADERTASYRDESNGTTKSKNKLHLTIFHKRMTS